MDKPSNRSHRRCSSLQKELVAHQLVDGLSFFKDIKKQLSDEKYSQLVSEIHIQNFPKFSTVFHYGDFGRKFYVIAKGSCFVISPTNYDNPDEEKKDEQEKFLLNEQDREGFQAMRQEIGNKMHIVAVLNQDKTFGEVALRTNVPRTATVICREDCILISIHVDTYNRIVDKYHAAIYEDDIEFLHNFPFLKAWTKAQITNLLRNILHIECIGNQVIYSIGDSADYIYFIKQGEFEILSHRPDQEEEKNEHENQLHKRKAKKDHLQRTALLGPNNSFGTEEVASKVQKRSNKIICVSSQALLYAVERGAFFSAMQDKGLTKDLREESSTKQNWRQSMIEENKQLQNIFQGPVTSPQSPQIRSMAGFIDEEENQHEEGLKSKRSKQLIRRQSDSLLTANFTFHSGEFTKQTELLLKEKSLKMNENKQGDTSIKFHDILLKNDDLTERHREQNSSFRITTKTKRRSNILSSSHDSFQSMASFDKKPTDSFSKVSGISSQQSLSSIPQQKNIINSPRLKPVGVWEVSPFEGGSQTSRKQLFNRQPSYSTFQPQGNTRAAPLEFPQSHAMSQINQIMVGNSHSSNTINQLTQIQGSHTQILQSNRIQPNLPSPSLPPQIKQSPQLQLLNLQKNRNQAEQNERPLLDCYVQALLKKTMIKKQSKSQGIQSFTQKEFFATIRQNYEKKKFISPKEEGKGNIKQIIKQKEPKEDALKGKQNGEEMKIKNEIEHYKQSFIHEQRMSLNNPNLNRRFSQAYDFL